MTRLSLTKIHMILAAFMFPVALMFLVTGGLYTWGVKGSYDSQEYSIDLDKPLSKDEALLGQVARAELAKRNIQAPTGKPGVRSIGTGYQFEWSGAARGIILEPTADPLQAKLIVKETSWYRHFVQLHKAKGGVIFKIYAAILAVALFLMLASGFLIAWSVPTFRKIVALSTAGGIAAFFFAFLYS